MGPPDRPRGQMAFKVKPQTPSNNEVPPHMQTVFRKSQRGQFNIRFKDNQTATPSPPPTPVQDVPPRAITFASNKTTVGFTARRERPAVPPMKKRKLSKYPINKDEPSLTTRRPVKSYVPMDAWSLIFRRSTPKFLIQARLVCRDFRDILTQQSIWREARTNTYRRSVPECPHDLSEFEFAKLLTGRGCQIRPCTQRLTRKVYWAFMLRMCEQCFTQVTQLPENESEEAKMYRNLCHELEAEVQLTIPNHLAGLLPAGAMWAGKFSQVRPLDREHHMWRFQDESNYCVIAADYEALKLDFRQKVMSEPSYFLFWTRLHWGKTKERTILARELDGINCDTLDRNISQRMEKMDYFEEKAGDLDPPMTMPVLKRMVAFHKAIETPNAASQRAWDVLASKIDTPELRRQAEQLNRWEREDSGWRISSEDGLYDTLAKHRGKSGTSSIIPTHAESSSRSSEQEFVLDIARQELDGLLDVVHDEDVLLMLLDKVRRVYDGSWRKPHGLNGDGREGEYRLLLDDARMVVMEILTPKASSRGTVRAKKLINSLRCVACTRTDCNKTYTFEQLMAHVRTVHAIRVGKELHFYKMAIPIQSRFRRYTDPVAWYHIPWPKSFPALPFHQRAHPGMSWNPDEEMSYEQHNTEEEMKVFNILEAIKDPWPGVSFAASFCKAAQLLCETRLDSICIVRIALEYATRAGWYGLEDTSCVASTSVARLLELESATRTDGLRVELKFKCGLCIKENTRTVRARQPRETLHPQPLSILVPHWETKHRLKLDEQVSDLICLPTDFELRRAMAAEDEKLDLQKQKAELANKKLVSAHTGEDVGQQTKDPRAEALLEIPSIASRFALLFRQSEHPLSVKSAIDEMDDGDDEDIEDEDVLVEASQYRTDPNGVPHHKH